MKIVYTYLKKTKLPSLANWFLVLVILLFALTSVIPAINLSSASLQEVPSDDEIEALEWLSKNTDNDSTVMARVQEGHLISFFADRKNVLDTDFLLVKDAQQRYDDSESVYSLRLKTEVVRRLNKYDVDYLYFSGKFGDEDKLYYLDEDCFRKVFNNSVSIYAVRCRI